MVNYSHGPASCPDDLHAVFLVDAILGVSLLREAVGLRVSVVSLPVPACCSRAHLEQLLGVCCTCSPGPRAA